MNLDIRKKVKNLLQPGEGLYQRTVRSGAWVFALRITGQGFSIIRLIILALVLLKGFKKEEFTFFKQLFQGR